MNANEPKAGPDPAAALTLQIGAGEYVFKPLTLEETLALHPHFLAFASALASGPASALEHVTEILTAHNSLLAASPHDCAAVSMEHANQVFAFWKDHLCELWQSEGEVN